MQPNVVKMNKPFIFLPPEITRLDALTLMDWLEDECVTRFLSDSRHVSRFIERVIGGVQLQILTHLFNQGGRFFMACDRHDVPVGFVRLSSRPGRTARSSCSWRPRQLGPQARRQRHPRRHEARLLRHAGREAHRQDPSGQRALAEGLRALRFSARKPSASLKSFGHDLGALSAALAERPAGHPEIYITEIDKARLGSLLASNRPRLFSSWSTRSSEPSSSIRAKWRRMSSR